MTLLNRLMKHIVLALTTLLFAFGLNMATSQEANAGEFEINGGFGFAGMYHKNSVDYNGFTFTIGAHYRFLDWLGLGVEQDLGALFNDDDNDYNGFYGATIFGAKFIYSFGAAEIFGRLGIGAVYVNMEYDKHHIATRLLDALSRRRVRQGGQGNRRGEDESYVFAIGEGPFFRPVLFQKDGGAGKDRRDTRSRPRRAHGQESSAVPHIRPQ